MCILVVGKLEVAAFIAEKKKATWSELVRQLVNIPSKFVCPSCKSSRIVEDREAQEFVCVDCGIVVNSGNRIARQTLLDYLKALIKEGIVEKVIDKETLKPVYQVTETGRKKLNDLQNKQRAIEMILKTSDLRQTLKEILKNMENKS